MGLASAVRAAIAEIPGSQFVGSTMPSIDDANDGSVRGAYPSSASPPADALLGTLYPLHTGEAGRMPGRILTMALGVWLIATICLGVLLCWRRSRYASIRTFGSRSQ